MKKIDWILILGTILFSILFYRESHGINYLIFTVFLISALLFIKKELLKNVAWIASAGLSLVSALALSYHGTGLALGATITSLSLMAALSVSKNSSAIAAVFYSAYSYISAVGFVFVDLMERNRKKKEVQQDFQDKENKKTGISWVHIISGLGVLLTIVLFFVLYQRANPLFKDFTQKINLDFIEWPWVRFTFFGFLLLYGFFYSRNIPSLYAWDKKQKNKLENNTATENRLFGRSFNINMEYKTGLVLIILLNALLAIVNVLDIMYMWSGRGLPEGMNYSDFVHQGTANLIFSVILAIIIILFFFRNKMHFFEKAKHFKVLAIIWMLQNLLLSLSTAYRNQLYISEYTLTYKRLGVYIWLAIVAFGLITTLIKLYKKKTNWFLVRANSWSLISILVLLSLFNWDLIITKFNIKHATNLDKEYLLEMHPATLPYLLDLSVSYDQVGKQDDYTDVSYKYDNPVYMKTFTHELHKQTYTFLQDWEKTGWQSWSYSKKQTAKKIYAMIEEGELDTLFLSNLQIKELSIAPYLANLHYLDISDNQLSDMQVLENLKEIQHLDLSRNAIADLQAFPVLEKLHTLYLDNNTVEDYSPLSRAKALKKLSLSNVGTINLSQLTHCSKIEDLDISYSTVEDYALLASFEDLNSLNISGQKNQDFSTLPEMKNIKSLVFQNNTEAKYAQVMMKFQSSVNMEKLDISNNNVYDLYVLTDYFYENEHSLNTLSFNEVEEKDISAFFPKLKELKLNNGKISRIAAIKYYTELEDLELSNNEIHDIKSMQYLKKLKRLSLNSNKITDIKSLERLQNLEHIALNNNQIQQLEPIKKLNQLHYLDFSYNWLTNIDALAALSEIRELRLNNNKLKDISVLQHLKKLKILYLQNNFIEDYSVLYAMQNLEFLYIDRPEKELELALEKYLPNTKIEYYGYRY